MNTALRPSHDPRDRGPHRRRPAAQRRVRRSTVDITTHPEIGTTDEWVVSSSDLIDGRLYMSVHNQSWTDSRTVRVDLASESTDWVSDRHEWTTNPTRNSIAVWDAGTVSDGEHVWLSSDSYSVYQVMLASDGSLAAEQHDSDTNQENPWPYRLQAADAGVAFGIPLYASGWADVALFDSQFRPSHNALTHITQIDAAAVRRE